VRYFEISLCITVFISLPILYVSLRFTVLQAWSKNLALCAFLGALCLKKNVEHTYYYRYEITECFFLPFSNGLYEVFIQYVTLFCFPIFKLLVLGFKVNLDIWGYLRGCVEYDPKWLLIKYEILPLIYKHTQGKLEGECSNSSEVT